MKRPKPTHYAAAAAVTIIGVGAAFLGAYISAPPSYPKPPPPGATDAMIPPYNAFSRGLYSRAARLLLPSSIVLPAPAAAFIRLMPGCVWGNGKKTVTVTRHTNQYINLVNIDTTGHRFTQTGGTISPFPAWHIRHNQAVAFNWKNPGTITATTCSGTAKLTILVS